LLRDPKRGSELNRLKSPDEIALFIKQQKALLALAERREADARVRHSNFELIQRAVLLVLAVVVGLAVLIGAASDPELLKLALGAGGILGAIGAGVHRSDYKQRANRG
jgi:hypothetical protein